MTFIAGIFAGAMCFVPGPFLLDYLTRLGKLKISKFEMLLLGSVVWNFGWACAGYIVAILTSSIGIFYSASVVVGLGVVLIDFYQMARGTPRLVLPSFDFDKALALVLIIILGTLLTIEIMAHSIFQEFDAVFYYLPLAKSIVLTGGLHFDPLHSTGLTTTMSPVLPLMYGSVLFFSGTTFGFGTAVRIIPLAYVALTTLAVYFLAIEILNDSKLALVSSMGFLSLPVLVTLSLNYALYLDFGFVFITTVSLFLVARVWRQAKSDSFTWAVLGISLGLSLLIDDTAYFIVPALLTLALLPRLRSLNRNLVALFGALVFTAPFDFFFVYDALFLASSSGLGIFLRQTTTLGTFVLVFLILRRMGANKLSAPSGRQLLLLILPLAAGVMYILRNLLQHRVVSFTLDLFNPVALRAANLIAQSGNNPSPPFTMPSFQNLLAIFTSYNGGFLFLLPLVLGIISLFLASGVKSERRMLVCLFVLALIDAWGWLFNFAYTSAAVRWLYELVPILAVLTTAGIGLVSRTLKLEDSMVVRFVFFDSLALLYLWTGPLNIPGIGTPRGLATLGAVLPNISSPTVLDLLAFSIFFIVAFIPIPPGNPNRSRTSKMEGRIATTVVLLLLLVFPGFSFAYPTAVNSQSTSNSVPYKDWENGLSTVINYVNTNCKNNYSIVAFYGLPLAYFTDHPVIDMSSWYGVATVLPLETATQSEALYLLTQENVRYVLIPNQMNSNYQYYIKFSKYMKFLSPGFINNNFEFKRLDNFADYTLYQIVLP